MAQLKLRKEIVEFAPLLLPRVGLRLQPQKIDLLIAASAASFSIGKSNGVVAAHVMRKQSSSDKAFCGTCDHNSEGSFD